MKKINLLILGIVAMFGFVFTANAAGIAKIECTNPEIRIGESTNCTVSVGYDGTTPIKTAAITLSDSEYLIISDVRASAAAGWQQDLTGTSTTSGRYSFINSNQSGIATTSEVFSFTVKLSEEAKKLSSTDKCGNLCISKVEVTSATTSAELPFDQILESTQGACYTPVVINEECTENCDPKNPETGAFMNYLIIVGVGIAAIAVILIVRKTTKFYRV